MGVGTTKSAQENSAEKSKEKPVEDKVDKQLEETKIEIPTNEITEEVIEKIIKDPEQAQEESAVDEPVEGEVEEVVEQQTEESQEGFLKKRKKVIIGIEFSLCTLLVIYFGMTKYFTNHFYFGSKINSISVSGKTVENAKVEVQSQLQNYTLTLKEREGKSEQIKASDVDLKSNSDDDFNTLKNSQNPFNWIFALFSSKDCKMAVGLSYNEEMLKDRLDKLSCFNSDNIIEPRNPSFKYEDNNYVIIDEIIGSKVDKDILYPNLVSSLLNGQNEIDLESLGCYITPQYNSKSEKTLEIKDTLNKYVSSKIIYTFGEAKETLDGSTIDKWLKIDDNFLVAFDVEKVQAYIDTLAETHDTVGKTRPFTTSSGTTINIDGGDYGWAIDREKERENLIKYIEEGNTITKEPAYSQTTTSSYGNNDIGNTYVEVSLSSQHLWFYKNGSLIVQGDVVTGTGSNNYATPRGVYSLKYKERNAILRGPGYAAPVSFWMPFNQDIGIHDATWRSAFGGNIYWSNGSHGCVNSPYYLANTIFDNIEPGTPVVCY